MIKIYNTMTKQNEEFISICPNKVQIYVCGPTVYNYIHIGNARPMVFFDVVRRYLEYCGYEVNYISNYTDIDDKIIRKAIEENVLPNEISERYIRECEQDMKGLNVLPATIHPKATQEISDMISMISTLIEKGYAYTVEDGTVYFRVRRFAEYGKLSHKKLDDLRSGFRNITVNGEESKEDMLDFVLWKPKKDGEPYWDSPWCKGRPGWHIECSVMSRKYAGCTLDIHGGGEDLIFPHHENEIAQSEAANNEKFANFWMHNAFINIDNHKMSKSSGNMCTVREISEKYDLQILRLLILSVHYRSTLNFNFELLDATRSAYERISNCIERIDDMLCAKVSVGVLSCENRRIIVSTRNELYQLIEKVLLDKKEELSIDEWNLLFESKEFLLEFEESMNNDFNTADSISVLYNLVKWINKNINYTSSPAFLSTLKTELLSLANVLGITCKFGVVSKNGTVKEELILNKIEERRIAKVNKDFELADQIRKELEKWGVVLTDTREGTKWKFKV